MTETQYCQFTETVPGKEWTCEVCGYIARINTAPRMVCGSATNKPKRGTPRPKPTAKQEPKRDPEAHERQLLEAVGPCVHRGEIIAAKKTCKICGARGELYDLYACDLHGKCTLGNRSAAGDKEKPHVCAGCPDAALPVGSPEFEYAFMQALAEGLVSDADRVVKQHKRKLQQ